MFSTADGSRPEDLFLSWCWHHPRATTSIVFGIISGLPFLAGVFLGALVF